MFCFYGSPKLKKAFFFFCICWTLTGPAPAAAAPDWDNGTSVNRQWAWTGPTAHITLEQTRQVSHHVSIFSAGGSWFCTFFLPPQLLNALSFLLSAAFIIQSAQIILYFKHQFQNAPTCCHCYWLFCVVFCVLVLPGVLSSLPPSFLGCTPAAQSQSTHLHQPTWDFSLMPDCQIPCWDYFREINFEWLVLYVAVELLITSKKWLNYIVHLLQKHLQIYTKAIEEDVKLTFDLGFVFWIPTRVVSGVLKSAVFSQKKNGFSCVQQNNLCSTWSCVIPRNVCGRCALHQNRDCTVRDWTLWQTSGGADESINASAVYRGPPGPSKAPISTLSTRYLQKHMCTCIRTGVLM